MTTGSLNLYNRKIPWSTWDGSEQTNAKGSPHLNNLPSYDQYQHDNYFEHLAYSIQVFNDTDGWNFMERLRSLEKTYQSGLHYKLRYFVYTSMKIYESLPDYFKKNYKLIEAPKSKKDKDIVEKIKTVINENHEKRFQNLDENMTKIDSSFISKCKDVNNTQGSVSSKVVDEILDGEQYFYGIKEDVFTENFQSLTRLIRDEEEQTLKN